MISDWSRMTRAQCRAARALLDWSAKVLAERAEVHITSVQRLENGRWKRGDVVRKKVWSALVGVGVEFTHELDGAQGIKLRGRGKNAGNA